MKRGKRIWAAWGWSILLVLILAPPTGAEETIKIALFDQLSGPLKYGGDATRLGAEFLAEEINQNGGLLGKKVEIIAEDSQFKPDVAVRKAKKQILDGVKFIGSGTASHVALALSELAQKEKVIYINYGSQTPDLTGKNCSRYFFRTAENTDMATLGLVNFLAGKSAKTIASIHMDYAFGHDAAKSFSENLSRIMPDAKIVATEFHPVATKDYGPFISKIKSANPDYIFTSNFIVDLTNLIKQARALGVKTPFLSFYLGSAQALRILKEEAVGSYTIQSYMEILNTPMNKAMNARWNKAEKYRNFETWVELSCGKSYTGLKFFTEAVRKAGKLDTDAIINAWEGMSWNGPMGTIVMRPEDHQAMIPLYVSEVVPTTNEYYPHPYLGKPQIVPIEKTTIPLAQTGCKRKGGE